MKRHKQLFKHDPANGTYGDCQRTAIACLLDKDDPSEVPNFAENHWEDGAAFDNAVRDYLRSQGFDWFVMAFNWSDASPQEVITYIGHHNPSYYMICGMGARGVNHIVICKGNEFFHDPHPSDDFLCGPCNDGFYWVYVLIPASMSGGSGA